MAHAGVDQGERLQRLNGIKIVTVTLIGEIEYLARTTPARADFADNAARFGLQSARNCSMPQLRQERVSRDNPRSRVKSGARPSVRSVAGVVLLAL